MKKYMALLIILLIFLFSCAQEKPGHHPSVTAEQDKCMEECIEGGKLPRLCMDECGIETQQPPQVRPPTTSEDSITKAPSSYTLNLDVSIPKDEYKVGELFKDASYIVEYDGESFEGVIIYLKSKGSYNLHWHRIMTVKSGDYSTSADAFKDSWSKIESFEKEGIYTFSVYVYDCHSINEAFGRDDCGGNPPSSVGSVHTDEIVEKATPLGSASGSVTIIS